MASLGALWRCRSSPAPLRSPKNPAWNITLGFKSFDDLKPRDGIFFAQVFMALSAAWSPGNTPLLYADPLVQKKGAQLVVTESTRAKWSANMPLYMVDQYRSSLSQLRGIAFDVGAQDEFTHIPITARALSQSLRNNGIRHTFEEYQGNHSSRLRERVIEHMLPFFSTVLEAR
jgi:S-formylglutathione hydrolase